MIDTIFNPDGLNVVVDTKLMFCRRLKYAAQTKGIKLIVYNSAVAFEKDIHRFPNGTTFFFGQVFYSEPYSGSDLGKMIKSKIDCRVFLVTVLNRHDMGGFVNKGYVDMVLPKDMYWSEPCEETRLSLSERLDLKKSLEGLDDYPALVMRAFTARKFWLSRMAQIEPSRIYVPAPIAKPVEATTAEKINPVAPKNADKHAVGWLQSVADFFKFTWLRPTPAT